MKPIHKLFPLILGVLLSSCEEKAQKVDLPDKGDNFGEVMHHEPTIFRVGDAWEVDGKSRPEGQSLADALKATGKTIFKIQAPDDMPAKYLDELLFAVEDRELVFQILGGQQGYDQFVINVHNSLPKNKVEIEPMLLEVLGGKQKENVIINKTEPLTLYMFADRLFMYEETCEATGREPLLAITYGEGVVYGDIVHVFSSYSEWKKQGYSLSVTRYKEKFKELTQPAPTSEIPTKTTAPQQKIQPQPMIPEFRKIEVIEPKNADPAMILPDEPEMPEVDW